MSITVDNILQTLPPKRLLYVPVGELDKVREVLLELSGIHLFELVESAAVPKGQAYLADKPEVLVDTTAVLKGQKEITA